MVSAPRVGLCQTTFEGLRQYLFFDSLWNPSNHGGIATPHLRCPKLPPAIGTAALVLAVENLGTEHPSCPPTISTGSIVLDSGKFVAKNNCKNNICFEKLEFVVTARIHTHHWQSWCRPQNKSPCYSNCIMKMGKKRSYKTTQKT